MTTAWTIEKIWEGETVAILGNGPAMTEELADEAIGRGYRTIAVNRAVKYAPSADMFVALDPHREHWAEVEHFAGIKIVGVESDQDFLEDAHYAGMFYERVEIGANHVIEIRNNYLAAMRIAARCGASKIVLLGLDVEAYQRKVDDCDFHGLAEGIAQIAAELRAAGVEVEHPDPLPSADVVAVQKVEEKTPRFVSRHSPAPGEIEES